MGECNVCLFCSDVYKPRKLHEAGSARARAAWGRDYKVRRTQIPPMHFRMRRIDCDPYMARSRDKIGRIWLTSGQAIYIRIRYGRRAADEGSDIHRFSQFLARQTIPVGGSY